MKDLHSHTNAYIRTTYTHTHTHTHTHICSTVHLNISELGKRAEHRLEAIALCAMILKLVSDVNLHGGDTCIYNILLHALFEDLMVGYTTL